MNMTTEKPTELKHAIEFNQELLGAEHPRVELLRWYHQLVHLPFSKLKILDLLGINPKKFTDVKPPKFIGCIYGAMDVVQPKTPPFSTRHII